MFHAFERSEFEDINKQGHTSDFIHYLSRVKKEIGAILSASKLSSKPTLNKYRELIQSERN
jgi:hypothetical protein